MLFRIYRGSPVNRQSWVQLSPTVHAAWFLYRGSAELKTSGKTIRIQEGEGVFIGLTPREQLLDGVGEMLSINYIWGDGDRRAIIPLPEPRVFSMRDNPSLVSAAEQFHEAATRRMGNPTVLLPSQSMSHGDYQHLKGWFHLWLAELAQAAEKLGISVVSDSPLDARLRRIRIMLDEAPLDRPVDYGALARHSGISRAHLERLFRQHFHSTPHAYFERRRAEYACHELLGQKTTIKEIASRLGFRHLSRFSIWFSAREHNSPRAYRTLAREASEQSPGSSRR
jgi:AraC-like DNA-binding protein